MPLPLCYVNFVQLPVQLHILARRLPLTRQLVQLLSELNPLLIYSQSPCQAVAETVHQQQVSHIPH